MKMKHNMTSTTDDQNHETIMLLTCNSNKTAQCMTTAFANALQFHIFTTENVRVFSEEYVTMGVIGIPPDFMNRIQILPHIDTAIGATAKELWIIEYKTCNKIDPAQAMDTLHYRLDPATGISTILNPDSDKSQGKIIATKDNFAQADLTQDNKYH